VYLKIAKLMEDDDSSVLPLQRTGTHLVYIYIYIYIYMEVRIWAGDNPIDFL
jgi:hypothetical protein